MMKILLALLLCIAGAAQAAAPADFLGRWTTDQAKSVVEIYRCGDKYCGKVVSLKEPLFTDPSQGPVGTPKVDNKHPNPALRNRPLIGLTFMQGFGYHEGKLEKGTVYDPETGKTYRAKAKLLAPDRLELRGYIGISLIGRSTVWTR